MASLASCIAGALDADLISEQTAEKLKAELGQFDDLEVINAELSAAYLKRRQDTIQTIKTYEALENIASHPKGTRAGILALMVKDKYSKVGYENIDSQYKALSGYYDSLMTDLLYRHKRRFAGLKEGESMNNVVLEYLGTKTGDKSAQAIARELSTVIEETRVNFNRAGGNIKKKDRYLPQNHSPKKMLNKIKGDPEKSKQAWIEYINDRIDPLTNDKGKELTPDEQYIQLGKIYDTITSDGMSSQQLGAFKGSGKLANKNQAQRILNFKDGQSWLEYHSEFGEADIYATMTDYVDSMARDTAALEVLGPNPSLTFRYLTDYLKREQNDNKGINYLNDVYAVQTGMNSIEQYTPMAEVFQETRAFVSAAMLGKAILSSFGDLSLLTITSLYNGISPVKAMKQAVSLMANDKDRMTAVRSGLIADNVKSYNLASQRFLSTSGKLGTGVGSKLSEMVIRTQGLQRWTDSVRLGFAMEFNAHLAEQMANPATMSKGVKNALDRYGFSQVDIDNLAKVTPIDQKGVKFLTADAILSSDLPKPEATRLHRKYMGMVLQESEYAAITPDAATRAMFGGAQKGTWIGEIWSTSTMFKSFPVTMVNTHISRALFADKAMDRMTYLVGLTLATGTLASLGLQAKELASGREPRPMDDWRFTVASLALGGGLGIFGDFLFADHNRFGGSQAATLGGIPFQLGSDVAGIIQTGLQMPSEEVTFGDFASQNLKLAKTVMPDNFYSQLLIERLLIEQLEKQVNPKAQQSWNRQARTQFRDYGNEYFWPKGQAYPNKD